MKFKNLIILFIIGMFMASCAHHRSGKYVLMNGEWTFQKSKIGFLYDGIDTGRIDESPYQFRDSGKFIWPVPSSKRVSSHFGRRKGRHHDGVDIPAVSGTRIVASASGKIKFVGKMRGYGNVVVVKHDNGYHTVYAHNQKHYVRKGQQVSQGEVIANVGNTGRSTGPHLHFEIRRNNKVRNPANYISRLRKYLVKKN